MYRSVREVPAAVEVVGKPAVATSTARGGLRRKRSRNLDPGVSGKLSRGSGGGAGPSSRRVPSASASPPAHGASRAGAGSGASLLPPVPAGGPGSAAGTWLP